MKVIEIDYCLTDCDGDEEVKLYRLLIFSDNLHGDMEFADEVTRLLSVSKKILSIECCEYGPVDK